MKSGPRWADPTGMGQTEQRAGGLRLTAATAEAPQRRQPSGIGLSDEPLRIERRVAERSRARGHGIGTFTDPDGRLWLTRVTLVDRSDSGLGVRSPVPVAAGATFSLSIEGSMTPLQGVVAHSRGRGGAYRLGLRCMKRQAA